ncbi:XTP/dITP diphosphatase [Neomoorella humiferrea]|uniref:XTP/dITP diphosphatase n=1 Tax=Neomoorella humiferrea TaxID=676965 RepID=UPI003D8D8CA6
MNKIVVATGNEGKAKEFRELLKGLNVTILTLRDFPDVTMPEENGYTFAANALLKARAVAERTGLPALADDSGLEVDFLKGAPGVYSARFAGEPSNDLLNNQKLLQLMAGVPWDKRTARFRCALALIEPEGKEHIAEGTVEGFIAYELKGEYGFGYDPLFYLPAYGKTYAELGEELKNGLSHRALAVKNLRPVLRELFGEKQEL